MGNIREIMEGRYERWRNIIDSFIGNWRMVWNEGFLSYYLNRKLKLVAMMFLKLIFWDELVEFEFIKLISL